MATNLSLMLGDVDEDALLCHSHHVPAIKGYLPVFRPAGSAADDDAASRSSPTRHVSKGLSLMGRPW